MADASNPIDKSDLFVPPTRTGETGGTGTTPKPTKTKSETINQQEFLNLLVHQLQNQDPLNPMENQEFAVQLAQFSQLEQLININGKLDSGGVGGGDSVASMASFLGTEVALKDATFTVADGHNPNIMFDMPAGAQSARVDIINEAGTVVASKNIEDLTVGKKIVDFNGVSIPEGTHDFRVVAVNATGQFDELEGKVTGTVEGFVLEPESALLVNGVQVPLASVVEVHRKA